MYLVDDEEKKPYFNVQYVDLNMDGMIDILATTNANGGGKVIAFEQIGDFRKGKSSW
jgi:hypothetical protein